MTKVSTPGYVKLEVREGLTAVVGMRRCFCVLAYQPLLFFWPRMFYIIFIGLEHLPRGPKASVGADRLRRTGNLDI
jgi:hypothetical protein